MSEPIIVFENDDLVAINKPVGMWVHNDMVHTENTVAQWFIEHYPESKGVGETGELQDGTPIERSGVVHRLDGETSGILLLAKTQDAYEHLKRQFHDRAVKKEYRAFVYGWLHEEWGTIDRPIGRSAKDSRRRSAQRGAKGTLREAVTDWELIGKGEYGADDEKYAYLKLMPRTGRTHQLRVHLRALDRPIVGDRLYANPHLLESSNLELDRLALHAYTLEFMLPNGETERLMAPLPQPFIDAEDRLCR